MQPTSEHRTLRHDMLIMLAVRYGSAAYTKLTVKPKVCFDIILILNEELLLSPTLLAVSFPAELVISLV